MLYAGWSDPGIAPRNVVNYFQRVRAAVGERRASRSACSWFPAWSIAARGNGTSTIDLLGTIDRWLDSGTAPARIDAARLSNPVVDRTRPLCPCPQVASYSRSGSTDEAASFICL